MIKYFRTRKGKLVEKLMFELDKPVIDVDKIVDIVSDFEKNNLNTIDKLQRKKVKEMKRIHGALKQCIDAHGPITRELISSAGKRIYGALLEEPKKMSFWDKIKKAFKLSK